MVISHTALSQELICYQECPWMEGGNFTMEALWTNEWYALTPTAGLQCVCMETASLTHPLMAVSPDPNRGGLVGQCRKLAHGEPALWTNKRFSSAVSYRDLPGLQLNIQHFYSTGLKTGLQVFCSIVHFWQWTSILWRHLMKSWKCSHFFCFFHANMGTMLNFSYTCFTTTTYILHNVLLKGHMPQKTTDFTQAHSIC